MKFKFIDVVLVSLLVFLLGFTITMGWVFYQVGSEPSTLIASVFALCGAEFGIAAWLTKKGKECEKNKNNRNQP